MPNTLTSVATIARSLVSLLLLGLLGTGGFVAYRIYDSRAEVERQLKAATEELAAKTAEIERLTKENQRLDLALRLLKVDHRVAEIVVLDQRDAEPRPQTRFQFVELAKDGSPLDKREFTIEGEMLYVDAWIIKYEDALVEGSDPLRSTSVCLFRRVFGEFQEPSEGFALDASGSRPAVYSQGSEMSPLERDIWSNFWEYANNPVKARQAGVRAAHGEAPSIRLEPGKRYRVDLRASAGLSIVPEDSPREPAS